MTRRNRSEALPLFAWGEALRRQRERRARLARRGLAIAGLSALLGLTIAIEPAPLLVWNMSPSAPLGFYAVAPGRDAEPGDYVIATLPAGWQQLAAHRHYLPLHVPLVKQVAARAGDDVCAFDAVIEVNGEIVARRLIRDAKGRPLPWWKGCVRLGKGQYFLLMASEPASFDGRYFGISSRPDIIGKAYLLWAV